MTESYRIVIVMPPGYVHSSCFVEVALLLRLSFESLGIDCDIKLNEPATDRTNIILGGHLLRNRETLPYRYIPYQLEQLSSIEGVWSARLAAFLSNAAAVWDYSLENIDFLKSYGIKAKHLPVGYHPGLRRLPVVKNKDIDVLFYGSLCDRRKAIIDRLTGDSSIAFKHLFGVYGEKRDSWIARSRIILNVHFYSAAIFEAVRISYLLNNGCFILSEESSITPYPGVDICTARYDELVDRAKYYLQNPDLMEERSMTSFDQFKRLFPMQDLLSRVL